MGDDTELELLVTVVVSAESDRAARRACRDLMRLVGGRVVESGDCSDEEPGCWSVTISRVEEAPGEHGPGALSRTVRSFVRELPVGASYRVSCEPPAAWTVLDNPDQLGALVPGGERLLIEAWTGGSLLPAAAEFADSDPDEPAPPEHEELSEVDENGASRPRLGMLVEVVAERRTRAEWQARALASRVSSVPTLTEVDDVGQLVRLAWDLGPALGTPEEAVRLAVSVLGGDWSAIREGGDLAASRWDAVPPPGSGVAGLEVFAGYPSGSGERPSRDPAEPTGDGPGSATVERGVEIPGAD